MILGCLQRGTPHTLPGQRIQGSAPPWEQLLPGVGVELVVFDFMAIAAPPVTLSRAWPRPLAPLGDISLSLGARGEYWEYQH